MWKGLLYDSGIGKIVDGNVQIFASNALNDVTSSLVDAIKVTVQEDIVNPGFVEILGDR